MPDIECKEPEVPGGYNHYTVDGVNVYLAKTASVEDKLKFVLRSFAFAKYVEVYGIKLI